MKRKESHIPGIRDILADGPEDAMQLAQVHRQHQAGALFWRSPALHQPHHGEGDADVHLVPVCILHAFHRATDRTLGRACLASVINPSQCTEESYARKGIGEHRLGDAQGDGALADVHA